MTRLFRRPYEYTCFVRVPSIVNVTGEVDAEATTVDASAEEVTRLANFDQITHNASHHMTWSIHLISPVTRTGKANNHGITSFVAKFNHTTGAGARRFRRARRNRSSHLYGTHRFYLRTANTLQTRDGRPLNKVTREHMGPYDRRIKQRYPYGWP